MTPKGVQKTSCATNEIERDDDSRKNHHAPVIGRFCRWVAMRAGWKMTAAARVVTSDRAMSLPMLDVPGWWESHRLPNAMPVVQALKKMARVRLDCRKFVPPERQA